MSRGPEQGVVAPDPAWLLKLARTRMPFGKYAGRRLVDLPEPYVVWFSRQGFPPGELGRLLQCLYEVKVNGLEGLLEPLRELESTTADRAPGSGTVHRVGRTGRHRGTR